MKKNGFTLLETLVSMMLLAIFLSVIFQLFSGGLKSAKLSDNYNRAIFHAKEKMEELLLQNRIEEGFIDGDFNDGFRWKAKFSEIEKDEKIENKKFPHVFKIDLSIIWMEGEKEKGIEISTIKLAEKSVFENKDDSK
ncbi:MAG: type II secretion system protein [Desulfobacterales bacterium]|nr:type II secretion system protein [Desulfobacterales bacterium]